MTKKTGEIKKYLPSKKFVTTMLVCIGIGIVVLLVASYIGTNSRFSKPALSISDDATLNDLLVQDSNNNGIADWEETLYGLNPKGDGLTNKKIIDDKKMQIRKENGVTDDSNGTSNSQTAELSREMLSTILALQQSDNLTPEAIANLTSSLGETVNAKRDSEQTYTINDMNISNDTSDASMTAYEGKIGDILHEANTNGIGGELGIIYGTLNKDTPPEQVKNLDKYIDIYTKMATEIISTKVPQSIAQKALALANACALMSHALAKIELMYGDAVSGLIGFDEYAMADTATRSGIADLMLSFNNQNPQ